MMFKSPLPLIAAALIHIAAAQTTPSMLYIGTLGPGQPTLDGGEYYDLHEYEAAPGEVIFAYLRSSQFDSFLALLDPEGNVVAASDDGIEAGLDAWFATEVEGGSYTFVVTSSYPEERGEWQLFVASGVTGLGEWAGTVEPGGLVIFGGLPAQVHVLRGRAGETVELGLDSDAFDAFMLLVAPDETFAEDDDSRGGNPRLEYTFPSDGLYTLFVRGLGGGTGPFELSISDRTSKTDGRKEWPTPTPAPTPTPDPDTTEEDAPPPLVQLRGNTWVFQTMSFPSAFGGMTNEFVRGHLTLFPAGRYEMVLRIGEYVNHYTGNYGIEGETLSLEGYGDMRFAQSGVRLTLWDSAGSIYGLALEGSCDGGVCAIR